MGFLPSIDEKYYSFAEYIAFEEQSEEKHDFYHGEIFAMAGGSKAHNNIVLNIGSFIKGNKKTGCDIFIDGMKVQIEKEQFYVYPDIIYTCEESLNSNDLAVQKPSLILEVLSDSTALYDKEVKLKYYKRIKSLQYYLMVSQKEINVEIYSRTANERIWSYQTFESREDIIELQNLGFSLPLKEIYDGISFEK